MIREPIDSEVAMAEAVMLVGGVLNAKESSLTEVFSQLFLSRCSRKLLII